MALANTGIGFGTIKNTFNKIFLGSELIDPKKVEREEVINSQRLVAVDNDEAADLIDMSHYYSTGHMTTQSLITQAELINEYRTMSLHAEVDNAIDDIVTEAVVSDADEDSPVRLQFTQESSLPASLRLKIQNEFDHVLDLLNFKYRSYEIFRQWYVDGRIHYQKIYDKKNQSEGILKLVNLDPRAVKKIKEVKTNIDPTSKLEYIEGVNEYYLYDPNFVRSGRNDTASVNTSPNRMQQQSVIIADEMIATSHSGVLGGVDNNIIFSHLEKARKPLNNLRMSEDAVVIYRITRAPERRVFYIDVGSLQKKSAEEYMMSLVNKYRTRLVYDAVSGTVKSNAHQISMMEDYWLPRREGGKGTEIDTLDGGENLGKIEDLLFFQKKLYKSLNVPQSRLEDEATISIGNRMAEITRDEWKFNKFIQRLRRRFNHVFYDLLRTQLILKNITTSDDWDEMIKDAIIFEYASDSIIKEQQEASIMENRLAMLDQVSPFLGKFFSKETVQRKILRMTDEEITAEDKRIKQDIKAGIYLDPMEMVQLEHGIHPDQQTPTA